MHADNAAGAKTPSLLNLELSFDITGYLDQYLMLFIIYSVKLAHDRNRRAIRFARSVTLECAGVDFACCDWLGVRDRRITEPVAGLRYI